MINTIETSIITNFYFLNVIFGFPIRAYAELGLPFYVP